MDNCSHNHEVIIAIVRLLGLIGLKKRDPVG